LHSIAADPEPVHHIDTSLVEHLRGGRPVWQAEVAILCVAVVLAVAVGLCLGRRKPDEVKPQAGTSVVGDEEKEGATPEDQLKLLKKKKTRCVVQNMVDKNKLEKILEEILKLEAKIKEQEQPDEDTIKQKADDALRAADLAVDKTLLGGLAYLAPFLYQSGRIYDAIDKRRLATQEHVARMVLEETKNFTEDMQEIFEVRDIKTSIFKTIRSIDAPSLATIVASVCARPQIQLMFTFNLLDMIFAVIVLICDAIIIAADRGSDNCHSFINGDKGTDMLIDRWTEIDCGIALFCVLVRYWVHSSCRSVLKELETPPDLSEVQDDPIRVMRLLLEFYLTTGTKAIMRYDNITSSFLFALTNWTVVLSMLLNGFAAYIVLDTPWHSCREPGLIFMRVRVIFFFILLVPYLLRVGAFFVGRYLTGQGMQLKLLQAADKADQAFASGVPVCTIMVQALLVRNKRDMISIQLQLIKTKKEIAEKKRGDAEKDLEKLVKDEDSIKKSYEETETAVKTEVAKSDEQLLQEQEQKKEEFVDGAEEVFVALNARAKKLSIDAQEQLKKFEEGEGGEFLQAMSRGEGAEKLQELLAEAGQSAAKLAEEKLNSEEVQQAIQAGKDAAASAQEKLNSEEVQQAIQAGKDATVKATASAQAPGKAGK